MSFVILLCVGALVGVTTVLFGFGGGFVTVPVIVVADAAFGGDAVRVATATSALVMLVNAAVATAATPRAVLARLRGRSALFVLLGAGGALGAWAARFAPDAVLRWGFVAYVAATVVDIVVRPGFFRSAPAPAVAPGASGLPTWVGAPIGAVAAFLGVGGSVMTVPLMRRAGEPMAVAATLANPLTLAIVTPALTVSLAVRGDVPAAAGLIGSVDLLSALALLLGSVPVVILLRRRPPQIPESLHAWTYLALLAAAATTVAVTGLG